MTDRTDTDAAEVDTQEMVMIHQVIHRALDEVSMLVSASKADDAVEVGRVADHAASVCTLVHLHHEGEDELLWPLLSERCPDRQPLVARMQEQHATTTAALERVGTALDAWRSQPGDATGDALFGAVAALAAALRAHCDDEERLILPWIPGNVTPEEWGLLPAHAMSHMDEHENSIVLGLMLEPMSSEERVGVLANLPAPVAAGWVDGGRDAFRDYIDGLRSGGQEPLDGFVARPTPEPREPPMG